MDDTSGISTRFEGFPPHAVDNHDTSRPHMWDSSSLLSMNRSFPFRFVGLLRFAYCTKKKDTANAVRVSQAGCLRHTRQRPPMYRGNTQVFSSDLMP